MGIVTPKKDQKLLRIKPANKTADMRFALVYLKLKFIVKFNIINI